MFQSADEVGAIAVLLAMITIMEKKDIAAADASEASDEAGGGLRFPIESEARPSGDAGGNELASGVTKLRAAIAERRAEPLHVVVRMRAGGRLRGCEGGHDGVAARAKLGCDLRGAEPNEVGVRIGVIA